MNENNNIIELINVRKEFDDETVAVDNFNLEVKKGEFVTFLGPSGCGKTTTLRMIAGFELPTSGKILLNGEDISKLPPNRRPVNTVFQKYALFPHMNVYDNIAFGLRLKRNETTVTDKKGNQKVKKVKLSKVEIDKKVKKALEIVDLEGFEKRSIATLSGGQQQRIAIARAIVNQPEILLLDEPLGALDLKMRKEMQIELKNMHKKLGITFIYVTHDQEEALTMSDKIVVINDGEIQQTGTPTEIYNEPINTFVADFIGESNIFNGTVVGKLKVKFCGATFDCLDDYEINDMVDVVVRPEDIKICAPTEGQLKGKVISTVFKGVHYEITVEVGKFEIVIQSTACAEVGATIGMRIEPDGIHLMRKVYTVNKYDGVITKNNTVEFGDGEFECDVTTLYPASHLDEEGYLITAAGEKIDLTGVEVEVEVDTHDIEMSDDKTAGGVVGNIISMIYKGDHYRYIVRTDENEEDYVLSCPDLWNTGDLVSLIIPKDKIKLKLKVAEEDK
ncbi:MAG: ABC transporter ATP-binding protein [Clostridiales bacterium]|nr:ABC transporter ATP-binding protein [Clostridiales bacterium]